MPARCRFVSYSRTSRSRRRNCQSAPISGRAEISTCPVHVTFAQQSPSKRSPASPEAGPAMFTLDNGIKDLRTMLAEGARSGVELPLVAETLACFEEASRHGLGAGEGAGISVYWSNRAANK